MDETAFRAAVAHAIAVYERAIGHVATRTRNMIETHGEVEALSRLMVSPDLQQEASKCFGILASSTRHSRRWWSVSGACSETR